jgi:hypothetical protein
MKSIDQQILDLRTLIAQMSGPGITNPSGAIQQLQSAGIQAVSTIGPAIDQESGNSPDVMKMTQWAWSSNGTLSAFPVTDNLGNVNNAALVLKQMADWYSQAHQLAQSKHYIAPKVFTSSSTTSASKAQSPKLVPLPTTTPIAPPLVLETHPAIALDVSWTHRILTWLGFYS